ncbi:MAG: hypothetical protein HDQ44_03635 [Desulfovibrio sp.]|nr:hypothetical protein [Desulfovibrio sp.]
MRVLKAYAKASALGQQNSSPRLLDHVEQSPRKTKSQRPKSGDSITLSDEAMELLANGADSVSVMPHDTTYDRQGNVMREFDNMQADLRALKNEFMDEPGAAPILGRIGSMQSQLTSLRASV